MRERIFILELAYFMFLAFGIVGNNDVGVGNSIFSWIKLIIVGLLLFRQMKLIDKE